MVAAGLENYGRMLDFERRMLLGDVMSVLTTLQNDSMDLAGSSGHSNGTQVCW